MYIEASPAAGTKWIVMPRTTPTVKVTQTEGHKAKVVLEGDTFDAAYAHARVLEAECGFTFVHPFDDPRVIAGQGTVAVEMLEDVPNLDTLLIPIGGHFVMNPSEAAYATKELIKPKMAWPMHYASNPMLKGTPAEFKAAMGQGPIQVIDAMRAELAR